MATLEEDFVCTDWTAVESLSGAVGIILLLVYLIYIGNETP